MPFDKNWIESEPDGTITTVSQLDNWIRDTKYAIRERLEASLIKSGTFASGPEVYVRPGATGVIIRDGADTKDVVKVTDVGIILGGSGLNNARIYALDDANNTRHIIGYFNNVPSGGAEIIDLGNAGSLPIKIWAALNSEMPAATVYNQGILLINRESGTLCYYAGNQRFRLSGVAF